MRTIIIKDAVQLQKLAVIMADYMTPAGKWKGDFREVSKRYERKGK